MQSYSIAETSDMQEYYAIENTITKIKNAMELYYLGIYSAEIFAIKMEEYSKRINKEIYANG